MNFEGTKPSRVKKVKVGKTTYARNEDDFGNGKRRKHIEVASDTDEDVVAHIPKESFHAQIGRELERIDRETLEKTLLLWYDQVTFDDEQDQIFVRGKNGLIFPVQFDEVERLIALNDERDELKESEAHQRESAESTDVVSDEARNETNILIRRLRDSGKSVEKPLDTGALPVLNDVVSTQKIRPNFTKERLDQLPEVTDVVSIEGNPDIDLTRMERTAQRRLEFIKKAAPEDWDSIRALDTGEYEVRGKGGEVEVFSEEALLRRIGIQTSISKEPQVVDSVSIDAPSVVNALTKAGGRNKKMLGQLEKEIKNRQRGESDSESIPPPPPPTEGDGGGGGESPGEKGESLWESEVLGTTTDDLYKEATEIRDDREEIETIKPDSKPLISSYEAALKRYPNTDPGRMPEPVSPDARMLTPDEVALGAQRFKESRAMPPEALEDFNPEAGSPIPEEGVDIELQLDGTERQALPVLDDVAEVATVDIELPLEALPTMARPASDITEPAVPTPRSPEVAPGRNFEEVKSDIALLERAKSDVAYGDKELLARYPEYKKLWETKGGNRDAAAYMWVERKLAEHKSEGKEAALTATNFFDERFESFGISKEDLKKFEGFDKLSNGQQMLVYESLKEYADAESRGEAAQMWASIKSVMGQSVEKKPRVGASGVEEYKDFLSKLIYSTALNGPRVHVENGVLMPDFIGMGYDREYRSEQKAACDGLNSAAHTFARIPASWQEDGNGVHAKNESGFTTFFKEKFFGGTESRNNFLKYEKAQKEYEGAKQAFSERLAATGVPQEQIVRAIIELDGKVHKTRFIETDPEAAKLFQSIPDPSFWKRVVAPGMAYAGIGAAGRLGTKSALNWLGLGSVAKTATGEALQFISGPAVAATLEGTRAWNRTAAEQRERDRKARIGTADISDGALNIVSAEQKVKTPNGKEKERDMGVTAKLERLVEEFRNLPEDAKPEDRVRLTNQLKARTTYSYDKFKLNRIQFGDKKSFAVNQARFLEALASAQIELANAGVKGTEQPTPPMRNKSGELLSDDSRTSLSYRLNQYLDYREGAMNDRRHREQKKRILVASSLAAGAALAGALAMDQVLESDMGKRGLAKVKDWFPFGNGKTDWDTPVVSSELPQTAQLAQPPQSPEPPVTKILAENHLSPMSGAVESLEMSSAFPESELERTKLPEIREIGTSVPDAPTPEERAKIQALFESPQSAHEITHKDVERGLLLQSYFINTHVHERDWARVQKMSVDRFMDRATHPNAKNLLPQSLTNFGKVIMEVEARFGVRPDPGEKLESYTRDVFLAIAQAENRGENTDNIRGYLTNIKKDWFPRRR